MSLKVGKGRRTAKEIGDPDFAHRTLITTAVSRETALAVREIAERTGTSVSSCIRIALQRWLKSGDPKGADEA